MSPDHGRRMHPFGARLVSWRPPGGAGTITLRDLLGHTAGANVPFYPGYPQDRPVPTLEQSLDGVEPVNTKSVTIHRAAAGRFRYSGGGFTIVQQLIEDVTGSSFPDVAREVVLEPLGMARSTFSQPPQEPLLASAAQPEWRLYPECAAAGLWTTPSDLARFVRALLVPGEGLTRETVEAMTTPRAKLPFRGQWLMLRILGLDFPRTSGLALFVRGPRFMNLGGAAKGFSALTGSTDDGTGAVVMTAGCRPPFAIRVLLELGDAQGWTELRTSRRGGKGRASDALLQVLS